MNATNDEDNENIDEINAINDEINATNGEINVNMVSTGLITYSWQQACIFMHTCLYSA